MKLLVNGPRFFVFFSPVLMICLQVALIWSVLTSRASFRSFIPARRFLDTLHVIFSEQRFLCISATNIFCSVPCHSFLSCTCGIMRLCLPAQIVRLRVSEIRQPSPMGHGTCVHSANVRFQKFIQVTICMFVNYNQARKATILTPRFQTSIAINVGRAISDRCPSGMTRRRYSWHLLFKGHLHSIHVITFLNGVNRQLFHTANTRAFVWSIPLYP